MNANRQSEHAQHLSLIQKRRVLLGLTDPEIREALEVAGEDDFLDVEQQTGIAADQFETTISDPGALEAVRLDPNRMRREQWAQMPGLTSERIDEIVLGRPYYTLDELAAATRLARPLLQSLFTIAPYSFSDPIAKRQITLTPVSGEYILPPSDTEIDPATEAGYVDVYAAGARTALRVVRAADFEAAQHPHALKREFRGQVTPVMRDEQGTRRYLIPGVIDIWFEAKVDERTQAALLAALSLQMIARVPEVGYCRAQLRQVPDGDDVLHAVFRIIGEAIRRPEVRFAEPDQLGFEDFDPDVDQPVTDADFESLDRYWNESAIDLSGAHAITHGSDKVTVLIVDSGCRMDHEALVPAFPGEWPTLDLSFDLDEAPAASSPHEVALSHGTKVAGVVRRIAPACHILPVRIPGGAGGAAAPGYGLRAAAILSALDYVPAGEHAVMNLSWKTNGEHIGIREALRAAESRGVVIVASAGNYPAGATQQPDKHHYPSGHSYLAPANTALLTVAALASGDVRASYSYYGANAISVSAPGGEPGGEGESIYTTSTPAAHAYTAGTSFAAPHVAGLAALLFSAKPSLTATEVISTIAATADGLDSANPGYAGMLGAGRINARAALESVAGPATAHTVTATAGPHGTLHPLGDIAVPAGGSQRFEFLPDPGHGIADVMVDGNPITPDETGAHTLNGVTANHTIHVTFSASPVVAESSELININTATAAELATLPIMGAWLAAYIVTYRETHGPYGTIWDLTAVGMSEWAIGELAPLITV